MKSLSFISAMKDIRTRSFLIAINLRALSNGRYRGVLVLFLLLFGLNARAQDLIVLKNGTEIDGKVSEISDSEIKYRLLRQGETFMRVVSIAEVFMIKYESGRKEVFNRRDDERFNAQVPTASEAKAPDDDFAPGQKDFAGPRIGVTYISPGRLQEKLAAQGKTPLVTQFGWQFEKRLFGFKDGPTGVFEFVPFIGGMEQGLFLPSMSMLIGLRSGGERAPEFAMGPNLSLTGLSMVFALGMNFCHRNVNFPVNVAYVPSINNVRTETDVMTGQQSTVTSVTGHRISLIIGFNVRKR